MVVGTILLDPENRYLDEAEGSLPSRPSWDKHLLASVCKKGTVSVSGAYLLPNSILEDTMLVTSNHTVATTIPEIAEADILIVTRSEFLCSGNKKFRFDNFKQFGSGNPEIWIKL